MAAAVVSDCASATATAGATVVSVAVESSGPHAVNSSAAASGTARRNRRVAMRYTVLHVSVGSLCVSKDFDDGRATLSLVLGVPHLLAHETSLATALPIVGAAVEALNIDKPPNLSIVRDHIPRRDSIHNCGPRSGSAGSRKHGSARTSAFWPENADPSRRRQPRDQGVHATNAGRIGDIAPISQAVQARARHDSGGRHDGNSS